jgi:hypothetical protein
VEPLIRGQRLAGWLVKTTGFERIVIEVPEVAEQGLNALEAFSLLAGVSVGYFEDALIWLNRHNCSSAKFPVNRPQRAIWNWL